MGAYVKFCSSQLSAGALLQQLTESSSAFRELCKQCQQDPRTQGLPLSTFLVKPMQRITKYPLLIAKVSIILKIFSSIFLLKKVNFKEY